METALAFRCGMLGMYLNTIVGGPLNALGKRELALASFPFVIIILITGYSEAPVVTGLVEGCFSLYFYR